MDIPLNLELSVAEATGAPLGGAKGCYLKVGYASPP